MWHLRTYIIAGGLFALASAIVYCIHYLIFQDVHHIFIYMIGDLAFLPLEVFLVVMVIERVLARREKQAIREKMNMVIGAFFSDVGYELLDRLLGCFTRREELVRQLNVSQDWSHADFRQAMSYAAALDLSPDCRATNLEELKSLLVTKRQFMLTLLENPNVLEHERFTNLLWAAFHLAEEFEARETLGGLPEADLEHMSNDIRRLYGQLLVEWVAHAEHLKTNYPFLFSLVARTHPFQESPSAVISA